MNSPPSDARKRRVKTAGKPVFDASAALALLLGEPGAEKLLKLQPHASISSVNAAEVLANLVSRGMPLAAAQEAFAALHLAVTPFDSELAVLSARFVHKGLSLGNRCFLAACQGYGHGWTSDHGLDVLASGLRPAFSFFR
jgi:ribonuclease VapC